MRIAFFFIFILLATALLFAFPPPEKTTIPAQEKNLTTVSYPSGKSFPQATQEAVLSYFNARNAQKITYGDLSFALWDLMPPIRKNYLLTQKHFDPSAAMKKYSGAHFNFRTKTLRLANHRKDPDRENARQSAAITLANFDQGIGLIVKFPLLSYKVYYSPISIYELRAFTISPSGEYWDKQYYDLDRLQKKIRDPAYYLAYLDAAFRGDFTLAKTLPDSEQESLIDTMGITIAEYFNAYQVLIGSQKMRSPLVTENRGTLIPLTREAPPFANALLSQFYRAGVFMVSSDNGRAQLKRAFVLHYYNKSQFLPPDRFLNEQIITRGLIVAHPYELSAISAQLNNRYADNYFNMLAYVAEHPELYDMEMRMNLWKIIKNLRYDAPVVNAQLQDYIDTHISNPQESLH